MLDGRRPGQLPAYEAALGLLADAATGVEVLVPGHGAVATGPEVASRVTADRAYLDALRRDVDPRDARLEQDWLTGIHRSNQEQARQTSG